MKTTNKNVSIIDNDVNLIDSDGNLIDYNENIKEKIIDEDGALLILSDKKFIRNLEMKHNAMYDGITIEKLEAFAQKSGLAHDSGRVDFQQDFDNWNIEYHLLEGRKVGIASYTFMENDETYYTIMSYEQFYNYLEIEVRDYIEEYGEKHENVLIVKDSNVYHKYMYDYVNEKKIGIRSEYTEIIGKYNLSPMINEDATQFKGFKNKEEALKFAKDENLEVIGYEERTLTKSLEKVRVNLEISEDRYNTNGDKPWYDTSGYESSTKYRIRLEEEMKQKELLKQIEEMVKNA